MATTTRQLFLFDMKGSQGKNMLIFKRGKWFKVNLIFKNKKRLDEALNWFSFDHLWFQIMETGRNNYHVRLNLSPNSLDDNEVGCVHEQQGNRNILHSSTQKRTSNCWKWMAKAVTFLKSHLDVYSCWCDGVNYSQAIWSFWLEVMSGSPTFKLPDHAPPTFLQK